MTENVDDQIYKLFCRVDNKLLDGDFATVDSWLEQLDVEPLSTSMLVAWLSITAAARSKLHSRAAFVQRAEQQLLRLDPDRIDGLMEGLR